VTGRTRRRTSVLGVGLVLAALTVSCSSGPSSRSQDAPTSSTPSTTSPSSSPSSKGRGAAVAPLTSLRLTTLPGIAQPGVADTSADDAGSVLLASARPAEAGALVTLQRRTGSGWRSVATAPTNAKGLVRFVDPAAGPSSRSVHRVVSRTRPQVSSTGADDWRLSFSDEFDGTTLGPKWSYRQLGVLSATSGRTVSESSKRAVSVGHGVLSLQVRADPTTKGHFLNGHISTETTYLFRYGVAAARIKFQRPRGTHGAFWLQSPTMNSFPGDPARAGSEIDIGEYFGDGFPGGGLASYVYHLDKDAHSVKVGDVHRGAVRAVGSPAAFWKRFHVYSVEWSPDGYVFRIDGDTVFSTDEGVSRRTQFLILSLLSSDWELPDLDRSLLPATMQVDWVRVWQHPSQAP
jgi:beta-glucanase (GH16 family)